MRMTRGWLRASVAGGLALSCFFASGCKAKHAGPPAAGPVEVSVMTLQPRPLTLTTELPGRVNASLVAEIRPQVNGLIKRRLFEEGSLVRAGQVLYQIDPATYRATLAQAEANLASAEANVPSLEAKKNRYAQLLAIHAVGQQDYDDALASWQQAKAAVAANRAAAESARINLAYTPISSPINGRIGKSSVTVGGLVTSYQTTVLATVQQLDPVFVDVVQANADLLRLRRRIESGAVKVSGDGARKVRLHLEDGTEYGIPGTLEFRDVTVDSSTGSVTMRMKYANPKQVLLPGMYVRAVVEEGVRPDALLVPQQAVTRDAKGLAYAWVVGQDGKVERRSLDLDRAVGDAWLVNKGVAAAEQVIMEGGDRVRAGMAVHAVPYQAGSGGSWQPAALSSQREGR